MVTIVNCIVILINASQVIIDEVFSIMCKKTELSFCFVVCRVDAVDSVLTKALELFVIEANESAVSVQVALLLMIALSQQENGLNIIPYHNMRLPAALSDGLFNY